MTDEFDPTRPGPPREVHEDAAARGRSMTAEGWARVLRTKWGDYHVSHVDDEIAQFIVEGVNHKVQQAHAAGKAEGAAEERAAVARETQMTSGTARIAAERKRQIEEEGWTPEHDDTHANGELAGAAACYAVSHIAHWAAASIIARVWPWDPGWWKRSDDPIRDLEKAGALIAAEIDRRIRARSEGGDDG